MRIPFTLQDTVSPDRVGRNRLNDTLKLKLGLHRLGFYEPDDDTFIPAATEDVWSALRDFQRARGLKVDALAKPDGPTIKAMNVVLAKAPARPVIRGAIPSATTDTIFKNERTVRGMGGYSDSGDLPAFMASALRSRDGHGAAPEVADLLKQTRAINPKQGDHMRTQLSELLDPEDMARIDDAAGVPKAVKTKPEPASDDVFTGQSGEDRFELDAGSHDEHDESQLPAPTDQPIDADFYYRVLGYEQAGDGDIRNALGSPVDTARVVPIVAEAWYRSKFAAENYDLAPAAEDAFRHAYWSYRMAKSVGEEASKQFGDAHERKPLGVSISRVPGNPEGEKLKDLYNNRIGRDLYRDTRKSDGDDIEAAVLGALTSGSLQIQPFTIRRRRQTR